MNMSAVTRLMAEKNLNRMECGFSFILQKRYLAAAHGLDHRAAAAELGAQLFHMRIDCPEVAEVVVAPDGSGMLAGKRDRAVVLEIDE